MLKNMTQSERTAWAREGLFLVSSARTRTYALIPPTHNAKPLAFQVSHPEPKPKQPYKRKPESEEEFELDIESEYERFIHSVTTSILACSAVGAALTEYCIEEAVKRTVADTEVPLLMDSTQLVP